MKEIVIESNSEYTILYDGYKHCLIPVLNESILLKSGSFKQCKSKMEQLRGN